MSNDKNLVFVRLSPSVHQKLKIRCAQQQISMQRYVELLVLQSLMKRSPLKKSPKND